MTDPLYEAAYWALCYFKAMDEANAQVHCAPVRYSPITFRLAYALRDENIGYPEMGEVLAHAGRYEEDPGR